MHSPEDLGPSRAFFEPLEANHLSTHPAIFRLSTWKQTLAEGLFSPIYFFPTHFSVTKKNLCRCCVDHMSMHTPRRCPRTPALTHPSVAAPLMQLKYGRDIRKSGVPRVDPFQAPAVRDAPIMQLSPPIVQHSGPPQPAKEKEQVE